MRENGSEIADLQQLPDAQHGPARSHLRDISDRTP